MDLEELRRRSYIGGAVATLAGLAGCPGGGDAGGTDERIETGEETTTGSETSAPSTDQSGVPEHDHGSGSAGGERLGPESVHGDVYAAAMPGDDLSAKIDNAIDAVPAGGAVVVTPREDGDPWQWTETLTVNLRELGGVTLLFRGTTMIEYTGDGWALDVRYAPADYGQIVDGALFDLRGGYWQATGNPDGWLRLVDTNYSRVEPHLVRQFMNDDITATGIRVENRGHFCEANTFSGIFDKIDVGMDFVPAAVTGGDGTDSFGSTYIRNLKVYSVNRSGFRWREDAGFYNSTVQNPMSLAGTGNDQADSVAAYDLGGDFNGTVFISPKIEDAGAAINADTNDSNDAGYHLRSTLGTPPLVLNPVLSYGVDEFVRRDQPDKRLPALVVDESGRAGVHDLGRADSETRFDDGGVTFAPQTLFGSGSQEPTTVGNVVYHDGDENVPAGLYRADPENSRWVKVEDNSVTFED